MKTTSSFPVRLLLITVATIALISCRPAPSGKAPSTLRIVTSFKIQAVDPAQPGHYFLVEFGAVELPLIRDAKTNHITPWVVESYQRIDDLNWRLTLRPNVRFQNGKPLTAQALAAAMNRQLNKSASTKSLLPGAKVTVTGDREVTLTTLRPDPNVPSSLADETGFPIYDVEAIEATRNDRNLLATCRCYTGPYQVNTLDDRQLALDANTSYWRGTPPLKTVVVQFVADPLARILAVQNGEADVALYPPTEAKRMLSDRNDAFFNISPINTGGPSLVFNLRHAPFNELAVRRAISLGLDYAALAGKLMDGVYATATGFYPPSFPWAVQNQASDLSEARRLLNDAGWEVKNNGVRERNGLLLDATLLVYPQQPDWITLATAVQGQLRELGMRLSIRQVDDIDAAMKDPLDWNMAVFSAGIVTTGGSPDPILNEAFRSGAEQNYGGVADAELNKLLDDLGQTFAEEERTELLKRIQKIVIVEKAYQIRALFSRSRVVVGPVYRNYQPSPLLHHVTYETKPG